MANETNEMPNFRLPEPFQPGSRLTARNMQDLRGAIAFCLGDMIVDGPGILITKTAGGQYIFEARRAGRRGGGKVSSSLRLKPVAAVDLDDPSTFNPTNPQARITSGNFCGFNWDGSDEDLFFNLSTNGDWEYFYGYIPFDFGGFILHDTADQNWDWKDLWHKTGDSPAQVPNVHPTRAVPEQGEAYYYIGRARAVEVPESSPVEYTVEAEKAHDGGNLEFAYTCNNIIKFTRV